jgi:putative FmdB family regulatory protein
MPVYEFVCTACDHAFEVRRDVGGPDPACPRCGTDGARRRFSFFAAGSSPSAGGGCACGGACACSH